MELNFVLLHPTETTKKRELYVVGTEGALFQPFLAQFDKRMQKLFSQKPLITPDPVRSSPPRIADLFIKHTKEG